MQGEWILQKYFENSCFCFYKWTLNVIAYVTDGKCFTLFFPSYNQQDATFLDLFISIDALQVSGGSSTHHQEHKTVHRASGLSPNTVANC